MPSEIKARLRYFNLFGCMFYEFGTVGQAGRAAFRTFETGGTVAAVGCRREKTAACQPAPAFSDGMYRRRQACPFGGKQYGGIALENDCTVGIAAVGRA